MEFYDKTIDQVIKTFNSDSEKGLNKRFRDENQKKYGKNLLTKQKKKGLFSKLLDSLKEPMLLILIFSFFLALGTNIGKLLKSGDGDFLECAGIFLAIALSVSITLIMESTSERAFNALNKMYDNVKVKVIRDGQILTVRQMDVLVGDIILIESGDKIVADGRLIESNSLTIDESALTGESLPLEKNAKSTLSINTPLAERTNMVYSGTFVTGGTGKFIVTAVGDNSEIGKIAGVLTDKNTKQSPLQQKLNKLGKTISIIGAVSAVIVFGISIIKLISTHSLTFDSVQDLFISSIILIVAAVPEGLPTIVAMSLALNMIKLAGDNALIKKISATETTGAVSVICSDKTGTLTENKMKVVSICVNEFCSSAESSINEVLRQNFVCNSTADLLTINGKLFAKGSGTECALLSAYLKSNKSISYSEYRNMFEIVNRQPFSSDNKYMSTTIRIGEKYRQLVKGAPEVILEKCTLSTAQKNKILYNIEEHQKKARRVICFAHIDLERIDEKAELVYDGFASLADPIRKEVYKAVKECKSAGIKIKILTGDNRVTAFAIAKELKIADNESQIIDGQELEKLSDQMLKKVLLRVSVIARSTPIIKLRVVKALRSMGEVVAVTGDGINDAPAIKQADVGIAMGKSGSEITKEAGDIVLLDDSFATVVKAISFGRNVYKNLQRFILFQLSVNLSALFFITLCAILGYPTPFNTFQLLWINVIMDGPPALTLGLERASSSLMKNKPIKKSQGIVSKNMLIRIIINGLLIGGAMLFQYVYNFLGVKESEKSSTVFTLFILFQLFNAFNSRELGAQSIFANIGKNKIMLVTFSCVFIIHILIICVCYPLFSVKPMSILAWIKTLLFASLIVVVSEIYKLMYRLLKSKKGL